MEFCTLEKTQKTYIHFCRFYQALKSNKHPIQIENELQCSAITEHLVNNCFNLNDTSEKINWIRQYSAQYRVYLNTLRRVAEQYKFIIGMQLLEEEPFNEELFFKMVETWNKEKPYHYN